MVDEVRLRSAVEKALVKQSFMTLATVSGSQHPHAAGVLYAPSTDTSTSTPTCTAARRATSPATRTWRCAFRSADCRWVHPPRSSSRRAPRCSAATTKLGRTTRPGRLKRITSHGELDDPDNWFVKVTPRGRIHTFGLGVSLRTLVRHPLETIGVLEWS